MADLIGGRETATATIAAGGSLSAAVPLGGKAVIGIMPPATGSGDFDATTAYLLFHVSVDGTTYKILKDKDGNPIYVVVAANNVNGAMPLDANDFAAWPMVKVGTYKSDKSTVQTQTAETDIVLVLASLTPR